MKERIRPLHKQQTGYTGYWVWWVGPNRFPHIENIQIISHIPYTTHLTPQLIVFPFFFENDLSLHCRRYQWLRYMFYVCSIFLCFFAIKKTFWSHNIFCKNCIFYLLCEMFVNALWKYNSFMYVFTWIHKSLHHLCNMFHLQYLIYFVY